LKIYPFIKVVVRVIMDGRFQSNSCRAFSWTVFADCQQSDEHDTGALFLSKRASERSTCTSRQTHNNEDKKPSYCKQIALISTSFLLLY